MYWTLKNQTMTNEFINLEKLEFNNILRCCISASTASETGSADVTQQATDVDQMNDVEWIPNVAQTINLTRWTNRGLRRAWQGPTPVSYAHIQFLRAISHSVDVHMKALQRQQHPTDDDDTDIVRHACIYTVSQKQCFIITSATADRFAKFVHCKFLEKF